jgi:N-acetylmuramoyl-L-alanine amidase
MDFIRQPATRSAVELNRWLKLKGCPEYAHFYAEHGIKYSIAWDIAIFQSIQETGWFRFGGDVKRNQNNFGGIGATGGGVPGDSFPSPSAGIHAQMQNLALRSGLHIPVEQIISPYTKRHYTTIANRRTLHWHQLAGTYASDREYWNKIKRIRAEYDAWSLTQNKDVTWFEIFRREGQPLSIVAYAGSSPVDTLTSRDKHVVIDFLNRYPQARNIEVAAENKKFPGDFRAEPPPAPAPQPAPAPNPSRPVGSLRGKSFFLDPGHSASQSGAVGRAPDRPTEYAMNLLQAQIIQKRLLDAGAIVQIYDPNPDPGDLTEIGRRAKGFSAFISLHHNAFNADGKDEGTETYVHREASTSCRRLASAVNTEIVRAIRSIDRGVKSKSYSVLVGARAVGVEHAILVESYFIDDYGSIAITRERSTKAAHAIADALIGFFV